MMESTVIAVSTTKPRWVDMNGVQTWTSLVRDPSPVPLYFGPDGPEGLELALHTEVAYAFPIERYDYWAEKLGLDNSTWPHCFWGENITLTNLQEDIIRVGDRLNFSSGAVLEATGPRTPCTKMTWRLGLPGSALKKLGQAGLGFYMRVVKPGIIGPGDKIHVTTPYPENITIGDLARALDRGAADLGIERLQELISTPRLAEQTVEMLAQMIAFIKDVNLAKSNRWKGWRDFIISKRKDEAADITSFWLKPKDGGITATFRAGQFLPVRMKSPDGTEIVRNWSISDYDENGEGYRLTIKRLANGRGSGWMHDFGQVGAEIQLRAPVGQFVLERSGLRPVVLISAGIGITPMLSMLRAHSRGRRPRPLTWLHSTQSKSTHLFREDAIDLIAQNPSFVGRVHYTQPEESECIDDDYHVVGRITKSDLAEIVEKPSRFVLVSREIELNGRNREFYICGPEKFEAQIKEWLIELGVQAHNIHSESFSPNIAGETTDLEKASVILAKSGISCTWSQDGGGQSLLELAESAGLDPDSGCRMGSCGACSVTLLEGTVAYSPSPSSEPPPGQILLCCARPASPTISIDL